MPAPRYPWAQVLTPDGDIVRTEDEDRVVVRIDPAKQHDRWEATLLEIDRDVCSLAFGVPPCTASGVPCYNTFASCKDRANFARSVQTLTFCNRGMPPRPGRNIRPYILGVQVAPAEIQPDKGLAVRSQTVVVLTDGPDNDTDLDRYVRDRAAPAGGSFWPRLQARSPNLVGRPARLRRGYYAEPYSEQHFETEHYIIEAVQGPDRQGNVRVILTDIIKTLDRTTIPKATDGALVDALPVVMFAGVIDAATPSTVTLPPGASVDDGFYDGAELAITGNVGNGQRVVLSSYNGATRTANVTPAFAVVPTSSSRFEIRPLSLNVGSGKGEQYGDAGYVRIDDEVIRYTQRAGDVLLWPSSAYRAQFGTEAADHDATTVVQACAVWEGAAASDVVLDLLERGNVPVELIDTPTLEQINATWWSTSARITAAITEPTKASELLSELARDLNLMVWWHPVARQVQFRVNLPELGDSATQAYTDDDLLGDRTNVDRLDQQRLTRVYVYYGLRSAVADRREGKNYFFSRGRIDTIAESPNDHGDERVDVRYSRWLSAANHLWVAALVARRLAYFRDAPHRISFALDPRSDPSVGALHDITTRRLTDFDGNAKRVRCRVLKLADEQTHWEVSAITTTFGASRLAYIAPNGFPDYGSASEAQRQYAFIADNSGLMSDGTSAYQII